MANKKNVVAKMNDKKEKLAKELEAKFKDTMSDAISLLAIYVTVCADEDVNDVKELTESLKEIVG